MVLRNQKRLMVLVCWVMGFALLVFLLLPVPHPRTVKVKAKFPVGRLSGDSPFITTFPYHHGNDNQGAKVKTILLWTQFFGSKNWATDSSTFQSCAVTTCRTTQDKGEISHADAVVMNVRDFSSLSDLPPSHPAHQVWILHGSEPPYYIFLNLADFNNVFNWTSWYRSDADIFSPYGSVSPITVPADQQAKQPLPDEPHLQFRDPLPDAFDPRDAVSDVFSRHDRLLFWAASSCINPAQRYRRVAELQRLLPVDMYGDCGNLKCQRNDGQCERTLARYKFVLAFENGYCRDYVTEKYWNALERLQIPIVSGAADYSKVGVPGSYIDVDNFTSTEELARFVQRVGSDRELYNSFFSWRNRVRLKRSIANWCAICQALHDPQRPAQVYSDLQGWVGDDSCPLYKTLQIIWWIMDLVSFTLFG